ncbi:hypothetical protein MHTCC0001_31960 [Flavobacteriaceae bacterium MHTCC 0001]
MMKSNIFSNAQQSIFTQKSFWEWLYSKKPITDALLDQIKTTFDYHEKEHISELEGKPYSWMFRSLCIDFPLSSDYSITSQFLLSSYDQTGDFDEVLYLKHKEKYYVLGWIDCHHHSNVFRHEEFDNLVQYVFQSDTTEILKYTTHLFLARYVGLTEEKNGITLIENVIISYKKLFDITYDLKYNIKKMQPYNQPILPEHHTGMVMKFKNVNVENHPIGYGINEGATWRKKENGNYHLEGFAANSTRCTFLEDKSRASIDIYDVDASLDGYRFPYGLWDDLMRSITK